MEGTEPTSHTERASAARNDAASPMPSIVQKLPSGTSRLVSASRSWGVVPRSISGVITAPGQIALTLMP